MKVVKIIILSLLIICVIVNVGWFLFDLYGRPDFTTKTSSNIFSTSKEKVTFLKKYLKFSSEVFDTEFYVEYQDNSHGLVVPGPSDWYIIAALKVPKEEINKWIEGFNEVSSDVVNLTWWDKLNINSDKWERKSTPRYYKRSNSNGVFIVIYQEEGIVFKMVTTIGPEPD